MVKVLVGTAFLALIAMGCGAPTLTFADELPSTGAGGSTIGGIDAATDPDSSVPANDVSTIDGPVATGDSTSDAVVMVDVVMVDVMTSDAAPSCSNMLVDGEESDLDCGGPICKHCSIGNACRQDMDCNSAYCKLGSCAQGNCVDSVKNLKETDVDCGGGDCPPCGVGASCVSDADCAQRSCITGKCQSFACDDRLLGPAESDVDCGGPACAACAAGKRCNLPRDCASGVCTNQICAPPTCSDGVENGVETGKDCGGTCLSCQNGLGCLVGGDCASGVCAMRVCQPSTCSDKVKNGTESDLDCGGTCGKCGAGHSCMKDADCTRGNCAVTCQPCPKDMVNVPTTNGASSYCVDATEVTVAAYGSFLMSNPPTSLLPTSCSGKTSFAPSNSLDTAHPANPVTSVDWCDAYAYCASESRHLCGRIGGGSTLTGNEGADAAKSEWYNACSKGGTQTYPYAGAYRPICVDDQNRSIRATGWAMACVGGFPGLHDMSGNVDEWEDDCSGSFGQDNCSVRGGSYNDGRTGVTCSVAMQRRRTTTGASTGFRCCL